MSEVDHAAPAETPAEEADVAAVEEASPEDQARKRGWRPKEEFSGPEDKWVDAETFLQRGQEEPGLVRKELQAAERRIKSLEKTLKEFSAHYSRTEQRAYERALSEIQTRLDIAASNGDVNGVREATDELIELRTEAKEAAQHTGPAENDDFEAWRAENAWFGKDRAMTAACAAIGEEVLAEGYTGKAQIKEVDRRIREAFPEKFAKATNPNRTNAASVEGAGSPARRGGKSRSDLPADARQQMDRWVKQGLLTEAEYLKDFFGQ